MNRHSNGAIRDRKVLARREAAGLFELSIEDREKLRTFRLAFSHFAVAEIAGFQEVPEEKRTHGRRDMAKLPIEPLIDSRFGYKIRRINCAVPYLAPR